MGHPGPLIYTHNFHPPATFHLPAPGPPQPPLQVPSSITKVNLLFKDVVCGVSKLSSSGIHLSEVALIWGLADAPVCIDILSGLTVARHNFKSLHLWQVIGQSWQGWEKERRGEKEDGPPPFHQIQNSFHFLFELSSYTYEHLKNTCSLTIGLAPEVQVEYGAAKRACLQPPSLSPSRATPSAATGQHDRVAILPALPFFNTGARRGCTDLGKETCLLHYLTFMCLLSIMCLFL